MANLPRYGRPDGDADMRAYAQLVAATFAGDPELMQGWVRDMGAPAVRVLRDGNQLAAGMTVFAMGQYFGGRAVPCWGLAGVVIPAHSRARGLGRELLTTNLREQAQSGPPIASLYPASVALYRKFGYGHGGLRAAASFRALDVPAGKAVLQARPLQAADWPTVRALYAAAHGHENGPLERNSELWERQRRVSQGVLLQGMLLENAGKPEGYLVYTLARAPGVMRLQMHVRDWACTTPAALQTLLALLHTQRSVVDDIHLQVSVSDPLVAALLHDQTLRLGPQQMWMLRIVRVKDALEARGWPALGASADFQVIDEQLKVNAATWRLAVKDGVARLGKGGKAAPQLHIRGLAQLYSGLSTPAQLRVAGLLQGSSKHDAALAALFAGPAPWMPDYF
ncbi:MAG: GNAT family N-acetyltransferase [Planctomycetes bacterium]|nr:GNAT family N-acetyltransferase [Planctomycetota bacterium]